MGAGLTPWRWNAFCGAFYAALGDAVERRGATTPRARSARPPLRLPKPRRRSGASCGPASDPSSVYVVPPLPSQLKVSFLQGGKPVQGSWIFGSSAPSWFVEGHLARRDGAELVIDGMKDPVSIIKLPRDVDAPPTSRLSTTVLKAQPRIIHGGRGRTRASTERRTEDQAAATFSVIPVWVVIVAVASLLPAAAIAAAAALASVGYTSTLTVASSGALPLLTLMSGLVLIVLKKKNLIETDPLELVVRRPASIYGLAAVAAAIPLAMSGGAGTLVVNWTSEPLEYGGDKIQPGHGRIVYGDYRTALRKNTCFDDDSQPGCARDDEKMAPQDLPFFGRLARRTARAHCKHRWAVDTKYAVKPPSPSGYRSSTARRSEALRETHDAAPRRVGRTRPSRRRRR